MKAKTIKKVIAPYNGQNINLSSRTDFAEHLWKESWIYIKTVVDTAREPFLILDKDLRVMAGNESFYRTFQVKPSDTEKKSVYELGNGQWNIPGLRKLLEDILPKGSFFKGFEVDHEFPFIGRKVMILNARQIHFKEDDTSELFQPIIILAMENVTGIMAIAENMADYTNHFEAGLADRTKQMEFHISTLLNEIDGLKAKS
ncbi:MAG: hypothetical protein Q7S86_02755 [bacterium]|nr:hypothetical protein [bacterium]